MNLEQKRAYLRTHLSEIGATILQLSEESDFRHLVYSEIAKQFDDDHNVLVKTLIKELSLINPDLVVQLKQVEPSLLKFRDIEDENHYPQVYIPNFEQVANLKFRSGRTRNDEKVVIVLYDGDETRETFPGYTLGSDENLIELGVQIDEEFAQENEVWIISLNETVDNNGELPDISYSDNNTRVISSGRTKALLPLVDFYDMKMKCRHESWASGKSEVSVIRVCSWFSARDPQTNEIGIYNGIGDTHGDGSLIKKFKRKWKNDWKSIEWTYWHENGDKDDRWDDIDGDYLVYCMFEADNWPTGLRTAWNGPPGTGGDFDRFRFRYRSADPLYATGSIYRGEASSYSIVARCMEFTTSFTQ